MTTFGEINWGDDIYNGGDKKTAGKDLFLRLDEGSNEMRIVTQPHQYLVHKVKKDPNNPKDFGQKVYCSAIHEDGCPVCKMDPENKAKTRWLLGVISRKTGAYKILDISYAVFAQIRKLNKSAKWGDPTKYDIDVVVDKNGGPTGFYSVQPIPKEPLSAADQQIKDNIDLDDLKRRVTPPSPENVQKRLNKVLGLDEGTATASMVTASTKVNTSVAKKAAPVAKVEMEDSADLENIFPDYDSQN